MQLRIVLLWLLATGSWLLIGCATKRPITASPFLTREVAEAIQPMHHACSKNQTAALALSPQTAGAPQCTVLGFSGNTVVFSGWEYKGASSKQPPISTQETADIIRKRLGKKYVKQVDTDGE